IALFLLSPAWPDNRHTTSFRSLWAISTGGPDRPAAVRVCNKGGFPLRTRGEQTSRYRISADFRPEMSLTLLLLLITRASRRAQPDNTSGQAATRKNAGSSIWAANQVLNRSVSTSSSWSKRALMTSRG